MKGIVLAGVSGTRLYPSFRPMLERVAGRTTGANIFGYQVKDLRRFEVVTFDDNRRVLSVEEKPAHPQSHFAIIGLYF